MAALAQSKRIRRKAPMTRADLTRAGTLLGLMAVIAVPAGVDATLISQDAVVGIVVAGLAALVLISLLQMLGVLGGR